MRSIQICLGKNKGDSTGNVVSKLNREKNLRTSA